MLTFQMGVSYTTHFVSIQSQTWNSKSKTLSLWITFINKKL